MQVAPLGYVSMQRRAPCEEMELSRGGKRSAGGRVESRSASAVLYCAEDANARECRNLACSQNDGWGACNIQQSLLVVVARCAGRVHR